MPPLDEGAAFNDAGVTSSDGAGSRSGIDSPSSGGQGSSGAGIGNDGGGASAGNGQDAGRPRTTSAVTRSGKPRLAAPNGRLASRGRRPGCKRALERANREWLRPGCRRARRSTDQTRQDPAARAQGYPRGGPRGSWSLRCARAKSSRGCAWRGGRRRNWARGGAQPLWGQMRRSKQPRERAPAQQQGRPRELLLERTFRALRQAGWRGLPAATAGPQRSCRGWERPPANGLRREPGRWW